MYLFMHELTRNCRNCMGQIDARVSAIPAATLQAIFPDPFNVDTWNLAALSPYTRRYTLGISETFRTPFDVPRTAAWVQDDWHITDRLTLNLGLRLRPHLERVGERLGCAADPRRWTS